MSDVLGNDQVFTAEDHHDDGDWRSALGRVGIAARGVLYAVLGLLALRFAFGEAPSGAVSKGDAIALVQSQPYGTVLLALLAGGLVALALWQLVTAVTGDPVEGSDASDRAKFAIKGVLYGATAATALTALLTSSSGSSGGSGDSQQQTASFLMGLPAGRWIVGALGLGVVAFGLQQLWKHAKDTEFMSRLARHRMSAQTDDVVEAVGRIGHGARGVVIGLIGVFFVVAAVMHDPGRTRGLSGSLVTLREQPWGGWILTAVAAGLLLYGLFSFAESWFRRDA